MTEIVRTRRRIGVIIDAVHELYQAGIWRGIADEAAAQQIDLISFIATSQDGVSHFEAHYEVIRDFARRADLDGYILFSGSIAEHHGTPYLVSFSRQLGERPIASLSVPIPDVPSITVENGAGIEALVEHFINVHNLSRIVFIMGPEGHPEAEIRFRAYKEGLNRGGIPFRPELVFQGEFLERSGVKAMRELFENSIAFDGIIAVNDETAFGALSELLSRGMHVPVQIAVAGFDDVRESAMKKPSLTTVRQPLHEMGVRAVNCILDQLDGKTPELLTVLPAAPVFRRSCGCFSREIHIARTASRGTGLEDKTSIVAQLTRIALEMMDPAHSQFPGREVVHSYMTDLMESLIWDVEKPSIRHIFLNEVDMLMFRIEPFCNSIHTLRMLINHIIAHLTGVFTENSDVAEAGNILQQAKMLLQESDNSRNQNRHLNETYQQLRVDIVCQRIISSFEQRELLDAIRSSFPELGVSSFAVAVFGEKNLTIDNWRFPEMSRLLLSCNRDSEETTFPRGDTRFKSGDILPNNLFATECCCNYLFMPLFHREEQLGYALLQFVQEAPLFMYEELRLHISSALKSSFLLREFKAKSLLDELTGVYNRRGFMTTAATMIDAFRIRRNFGLMLLYGDVNGLKTINDTFGHQDGDTIIRAAASALTGTFREGDLIARVGGDEFVVLLLAEHLDGLEERLMDRFNRQVAKINSELEKPYSLSLCIGSAMVLPGQSADIDALMKLADDRLLIQKRRLHESAPPA